MRVLFIGDIIGEPGRNIIYNHLKEFKESEKIDFTIANAENLAGGFGVTENTVNSILEAGVDFCTSGNHIWDRKEALNFIEHSQFLIRPANYPPTAPGRGYYIYEKSADIKIGIMNLSGCTFMTPLENPFLLADKIVKQIKNETNVIILDFHAEATSEKVAMGWLLDGRVSAVLGTHTHVQTADEKILPGKTAFITDVGMTGGHDSIIGVEKEAVISFFMTSIPSRFTPSKSDPRMSYVIIDIDIETGLANSIERGQLIVQESS